MDVYVRIIETEADILVAACDVEIVGEVFEEDDLCLEVKQDFYCGDAMSLEACADILIQATILNVVGEKAVTKAVELGLVNPDNVLRIGGTVHAQMVRL